MGKSREIGSRWEETGPKKPIIYVPDNPGNSLTGDTAILKATRGPRGVITVRQTGSRNPPLRYHRRAQSPHRSRVMSNP